MSASIVALLGVLILAGCPTPGRMPGILTGDVTIGPLSPVEKEGEDPPVPPEVYEARKIMVYTARGNRLMQRVDIGHDGMYRVELPPGDYLVDINHIGIDHSPDVPAEVTIRPGETVRLDIDIDTGIR